MKFVFALLANIAIASPMVFGTNGRNAAQTSNTAQPEPTRSSMVSTRNNGIFPHSSFLHSLNAESISNLASIPAGHYCVAQDGAVVPASEVDDSEATLASETTIDIISTRQGQFGAVIRGPAPMETDLDQNTPRVNRGPLAVLEPVYIGYKNLTRCELIATGCLFVGCFVLGHVLSAMNE